jgi:uncharacterized protein (TIGR02246 family)
LPVSDKAEILELIETFQRALSSGDSELAASCYAEDGIFMPSGAPTAAGAQIAELYADLFSRVGLSLTFRVIELVTTSDRSAHVITESSGTERDLASGEPTPDNNRELFLLAREHGSWRIGRLIFNKAPGPSI